MIFILGQFVSKANYNLRWRKY